MLQISSANCSPIKPQNNKSFGRNDAVEATANWLDSIDGNELTEDNFIGLQSVSDKLHDGPLKTFTKILGIGGASFAAMKVGSTRIANKVIDNKYFQQNVMKPVTKFIHNGLDDLTAKIRSNPNYGENIKGWNAYFVNTADRMLNGVKKYAERGSENIVQNLDDQVVRLKNKLDKTKSIKKKNEIKAEINQLLERQKYAAEENLIKKATTTTAATGVGTTAVIGANKDSDGNGIADIGEHDA